MLKSTYWRSGSARPADPVRIIKIHDRTVPISRYPDPATPAGNLTTTPLALLTDFRMDGDPVFGFGFTSIGRFGQSGLIQERFAPRLLAATENELADGTIEPEAQAFANSFNPWLWVRKRYRRHTSEVQQGNDSGQLGSRLSVCINPSMRQ
jgi:hypothetical protein